MRVVIAGGHGKIALLLERHLADRGDTAVGLIRNPDQADDLRAAGATPIVCDLEHADVDEVAAHLRDADAVVFAAGAGPAAAPRARTPSTGPPPRCSPTPPPAPASAATCWSPPWAWTGHRPPAPTTCGPPTCAPNAPPRTTWAPAT
ncbi:Protein of unknown function [Micromonospora lupini str. Lupac 08]|uniref:NAD(P)-binding domain-containing protein n=1 Tax=Micromonospora lupini str. Lupac 08 TaxID=1150864 RepID=I0L4J3_9ACTN|nr:Protein of unknown function [Micromonospora lupini str. Lupac 08]